MPSLGTSSWGRYLRQGLPLAAVLSLLVGASQPAQALDGEVTSAASAPLSRERTARDGETARLVVLHRDGKDIPAALSTQVDQLLLRSIDTQLASASAYASEVPFEDVELAAGCSARDADCMQRIAASVGADWLLIRELARDASGRVYLTLSAHDGPSALVTRRAFSLLPAEGAGKVVPVLVERLYPTPRSQASLAERTQSAQVATIAGWSAASTGVALVTVGVVMGVLSRSSHRAYERVLVGKDSDVDRMKELLARSQQRARVANGLFISGAITGVAGIATLLWKTMRERSEHRPASLQVAADAHGAMLSWSGAWGGAL